MLTDSILATVRSLCNLEEDDQSFDKQLLPLINGQIMMAHEFGIGRKGFIVHDERETWGQLLGDRASLLNAAQLWLGYSVMLMFDPPDNSTVMKSYQDQVLKMEWMLCNKSDLDGTSEEELDAMTREIKEAINKALSEAKESGEFDGYTPVKDVDYFDGFSPVARVSKAGTHTTISITDKEGTTQEVIEDGDPTVFIDDTAGSGDTDKLLSADKIHSMIASLLSFIDTIDAAYVGAIPIPSDSGTAGQFIGLDEYNNITWMDAPQCLVQDVQVDGVSVLNNKVANIPISTKADKTDTVLETTLSLGRKSGTTVGANSVATGNDVEASGYCSHAEGYKTIASGIGSHAEGYKYATDPTKTYNGVNYPYGASGFGSHSEGEDTVASNVFAHAEGYATMAIGAQSHSEGSNTVAKGTQSHAEGGTTKATASQAHSEGYNTLASGAQSHSEGIGTTASGTGAHAEGASSIASGNYAHVEGGTTTASGNNAHAEGGGTTASGICSHAEGGGTTASGICSHSEGDNTIAAGKSSHAGGEFNVVDNYDGWEEWVANAQYEVGDKVKRTTTSNNVTTVQGYICKTANSDSTFTASKWTSQDGKMNYAEVIGNGTGANARSNARALDWDGNEYLMGDLYVRCNPDGTGGTKVDPSVGSSEYYIDKGLFTNPTTVNSNASTVINNALAAAKAAGKNYCVIPSGEYWLTTTVYLVSDVILKGAGMDATTLKIADGCDIDAIRVSEPTNNSGLMDLSIDGNRIQNYSTFSNGHHGNAINVWLHYGRIERVRTNWVYKHSLLLNYDTSSGTDDGLGFEQAHQNDMGNLNKVLWCDFRDSLLQGIMWGWRTMDSWMCYTNIGSHAANLYLEGGTSRFIGNHFDGDGDNGAGPEYNVYCGDGCNAMVFDGNIFENTQKENVFFRKPSYANGTRTITFSNNLIRTCSKSTNNTYANIYISGYDSSTKAEQIVISGNQILNPDTNANHGYAGIHLEYCDGVKLSGNEFFNVGADNVIIENTCTNVVNDDDLTSVKSAINSMPTEETGQELLAAEFHNTGLTDAAIMVLGMILNAMPQDDIATDIMHSISLECERLDAIYENWMSERSA